MIYGPLARIQLRTPHGQLKPHWCATAVLDLVIETVRRRDVFGEIATQSWLGVHKVDVDEEAESWNCYHDRVSWRIIEHTMQQDTILLSRFKG